MLISKEQVKTALDDASITINGVLHIGAHDCEELSVYEWMGIASTNVVWIEAMTEKVEEARCRGILNVYEAVVSDKDGEDVLFHKTNNGASSSILEMGTHSVHYPYINIVESLKKTTTTLKTFFTKHDLDPSRYEFWNLDIQGVELKALRGGREALRWAKAVYAEVNVEEVYKGCDLLPELDEFMQEHGFRRSLTTMTPAGWGDALYLRTLVGSQEHAGSD